MHKRFGGLGRIVGHVVEAAVKAVTGPIGDPIKHVKNLGDLFEGKPFEKVIEDAAVIAMMPHIKNVRVAAEVKSALDVLAVEAAGKVGGNLAKDLVVDLICLQSYAGDVSQAVALVEGVKQFIETKDAGFLNPFGLLLAAEIARSRDLLWHLATPVPSAVLDSLPRPVASIAAGVRCMSVADVPGHISLPDLAIHCGAGGITIGELIVFDRIPSTDLAGLFLWTHELRHVDQYRQHGMGGFAKQYVEATLKSIHVESNPLEVDADLFACMHFPNGNPGYLDGVCPTEVRNGQSWLTLD